MKPRSHGICVNMFLLFLHGSNHLSMPWTKLLPHSPSLVAIGLSVGYEPWHRAFVIGWSKYRFGLTSAPLHYGLTGPMGIPTVLQTPVTVPLHSPNSRQKPAVRAVQGDCERVYRSRWLPLQFIINGPLARYENCGLRMRRECRERFPRLRGSAIPTCITARALRTCRDACRSR